MRKIVKDFVMLVFVVLTIVPIMFITTDPTKNEIEFVVMRHEQYFEQVFHTYYVAVGGYDMTGNEGYDNYTDYPAYTINEETGEWSDGGDYGVFGNDFYKVNESGERTRIGVIVAVEYGHKLISHLG